MLKKSITYTDFNGLERTEDFYFNLTKSELAEMEIAANGGMKEKLERIIAAQNGQEILNVFKDVVLRSYGIRSEDGRYFHKSPEISRNFEQSAAYDVFFMELVTDANAASSFINGLMPADLVKEAQNMQNSGVPQDRLQAAPQQVSQPVQSVPNQVPNPAQNPFPQPQTPYGQPQQTDWGQQPPTQQ